VTNDAYPGPAQVIAPVESIRVLFAGFSALASSGLAEMLRQLPSVASVSSVKQLDEIGPYLARAPADVLLVPLDRLGSGLAVLLPDLSPALRVAVVIGDANAALITEAALLPAHGFLMLSEISVAGLATALETLARGEVLAAPAVVAQVLASHRSRRDRQRPHLTAREAEVLALLVEGLANKEIARELGISPNGVKVHVAKILAKLNATNRTQAVSRALEEGLVAAAV
jgi:DNA-binding NarL/FixJ family response regulator